MEPLNVATKGWEAMVGSGYWEARAWGPLKQPSAGRPQGVQQLATLRILLATAVGHNSAISSTLIAGLSNESAPLKWYITECTQLTNISDRHTIYLFV